MQGILQARGERLEGFRMTEVNVLPVRVGEDGMEQHVIKGLATQGDHQCIHDNEVERHHVAGVVDLRKLDILLHTVFQLPVLNAPLERPPNRVSDVGRLLRYVVLLLEPIKNRIGLQLRIVLETRFDFTPIIRERIVPRPIPTLWTFGLAWQPIGITILAHRLLTHPQPPCDTRYRFTFV